jgi:hypothetical protein
MPNVGPKSSAERHQRLLSFQTLRSPVLRLPSRRNVSKVELPSPVELTVAHPSRFAPATTPVSLLARHRPGQGPHVREATQSIATLSCCAPGKDVAIYSSAVLQLSMSTHVSADSHFSARHPDPVKSQIA